MRQRLLQWPAGVFPEVFWRLTNLCEQRSERFQDLLSSNGLWSSHILNRWSYSKACFPILNFSQHTQPQWHSNPFLLLGLEYGRKTLVYGELPARSNPQLWPINQSLGLFSWWISWKISRPLSMKDNESMTSPACGKITHVGPWQKRINQFYCIFSAIYMG